jgi:hypothetical protein
MKTVELNYLPGDKCWVKGQRFECIIEDVVIGQNGITYNWYNLDIGYDTCEVWDDGYFTAEDIGKTVFNSLEDYEKAFPEDFYIPEDADF